MTTIAWDGKTLAADRRINFGSYSDANHTKIVRNKKGDLCGAAGNTAFAERFKEWFMKGEKGPRPEQKDGEISALIVRKKDGIMIVHDSAGSFGIDKGKHAIGSGWYFAVGAMEMGADANRAVEVASKYDGFTGSEVDFLWLHPPKATVEKTTDGVAIVYEDE